MKPTYDLLYAKKDTITIIRNMKIKSNPL